jgi:hypothetical protein
MLLMTGHHPQRKRQSGPRSAAPAVGAKRRALTDAGAEGIRPRTIKGFVFNTFTRSNRRVTTPGTCKRQRFRGSWL